MTRDVPLRIPGDAVKEKQAMSRITTIPILLASMVAICCIPLSGQVTMQNRAETQTNFGAANQAAPGIYGGYLIGVGDILNIHVNDEDSISGTYQVDQTGNVRVPLLTEPIPAAKSTTFDLANRLSDDLKKQDILREPAVTVLIVRGMTQNVSVLGAVMRPGQLPHRKTHHACGCDFAGGRIGAKRRKSSDHHASCGSG